MDKKLLEKLSEDAKDIIDISISAFIAIYKELVHGSIKISLLKTLLEKRDAFLELLKIGKNVLVIEDRTYLFDVSLNIVA